MADIDRILEELLGDRRLREGSAFSTRTYVDQPILQTGRQLQERQERIRRQARASATGGPQARQPALGQTPADRARPTAEPRPRHDAPPHHGQQVPPASGGTSRGGRPGEAGALGEDASQAPSKASARHEALQSAPSRYRELRAVGRTRRDRSGYPFSSSLQAFYEQARFMEDFSDSYDGPASFDQYFPTYAAMDISQLRAYFTWRGNVRGGIVTPAPVSFAYLHVYELLCGVGTAPGRRGHQDLITFWHAFTPHAQASGDAFDAHLRRWTHDYAIYHDIPDVLEGHGRGAAIGALIAAEEVALRRIGLTRRADALPLAPEPPTPSHLLDALASVSRYRLERSRLVKDRRDDAEAIIADVFCALVGHCARRRKTDFVEGLFGPPKTEAYVMYPSAVFFDPDPPTDLLVTVSETERYRCVNGRWTRQLAFRREETSRELGEILRATDQAMRDAFAYGHPLKLRKHVAQYVRRIIDAAVARRMDWLQAEQARHIMIDLTKLQGIRAHAAITRESLLVDEERLSPEEAHRANTCTDMEQERQHKQNISLESSSVIGQTSNEYAIYKTDVVDTENGAGTAGTLSTTERAIVGALLRDAPDDALKLIADSGRMASVIIDGINDKLFEAIGDAVIELVDEGPMLVADYLQDIKEIVGDERAD